MFRTDKKADRFQARPEPYKRAHQAHSRNQSMDLAIPLVPLDLLEKPNKKNRAPAPLLGADGLPIQIPGAPRLGEDLLPQHTSASRGRGEISHNRAHSADEAWFLPADLWRTITSTEFEHAPAPGGDGAVPNPPDAPWARHAALPPQQFTTHRSPRTVPSSPVLAQAKLENIDHSALSGSAGGRSPRSPQRPQPPSMDCSPKPASIDWHALTTKLQAAALADAEPQAAHGWHEIEMAAPSPRR